MARAQQRRAAEQAEDRGQQLRIVQPGVLLIARQRAPQDQRHQDHQHAGDPVDGAPAAERRQRARDGARQQDAEQQAAHDDADGLAALFRVGQRGGQRHQDLRYHREQPGKRGAEDHHRQRGGGGGDQHAPGGQQRHEHDQPAALEHIAERNQQQQPGGVTELRGGNDKAGLIDRQVETGGDGFQQRLRVIVAGDRQAGSDGDQHGQRRAEARVGVLLAHGFSSREEDGAQYPATHAGKPMYNFHFIYLISR